MRTPYDPPKPRSLAGPSAFDPGRRGVKALAAVAALVVLAVGYFAWEARPREEPVTAVPLASTSESATSEADEIVVAVSGHVHHPGLVRLPNGARVADAIEAAGGALPGVDLSTVNLARKVNDGELIAIGVAADGGAAATPGKVNLNTATLAQLDTLPGVGPVLAQRIIDHRSSHGGFRDVGELRQVGGIGEATYAKLKDLVTI